MLHKHSLYITPDSWDDLLNWITRHPKDEREPLTHAAVIGYNIAIKLLSQDPAVENFPPYTMNSQEIPDFKRYDDALNWILNFPKSDQRHLTTAMCMGWNFAVHCFELGNLREIANELALMTHEERVEASLFPLLYNTNPNDFSGIESGSIYILARDSGNIVKVGETSRDPRTRGHEYITEYKLVGFNFHKAYSVPLEARKEIERAVHEKLKHKRLSWDETTGAKEIFECTIHEAEHAVTEAIEESAAAKIARKEEYERQRLGRAEYRFNNELESYRREWMKDWDDSDKAKQSVEALDSFIMSNSFEKPGIRGVLDYFWLVLGWYFKVCAFFGVLGMLRGILFDPFDLFTVLAVLVVTFASYIAGWFFIGLSERLVPDEDKIAKRKVLEQEIERQRENEKMRAEESFRRVNSVNEFL